AAEPRHHATLLRLDAVHARGRDPEQREGGQRIAPDRPAARRQPARETLASAPDQFLQRRLARPAWHPRPAAGRLGPGIARLLATPLVSVRRAAAWAIALATAAPRPILAQHRLGSIAGDLPDFVDHGTIIGAALRKNSAIGDGQAYARPHHDRHRFACRRS